MASKTKSRKSAAKSAKQAKKAEASASSAPENPITKEMTLGEVVNKHPETIEVMFKHGLHCVGCHVATWETIEQGALGHGIDPNKLVEEMNKAVKETSKKKKK